MLQIMLQISEMKADRSAEFRSIFCYCPGIAQRLVFIDGEVIDICATHHIHSFVRIMEGQFWLKPPTGIGFIRSKLRLRQRHRYQVWNQENCTGPTNLYQCFGEDLV